MPTRSSTGCLPTSPSSRKTKRHRDELPDDGAHHPDVVRGQTDDQERRAIRNHDRRADLDERHILVRVRNAIDEVPGCHGGHYPHDRLDVRPPHGYDAEQTLRGDRVHQVRHDHRHQLADRDADHSVAPDQRQRDDHADSARREAVPERHAGVSRHRERRG